MTEYFPRRLPKTWAFSPWLWWTGLFLLLALLPTSVVLSQDPAGPGQFFGNMGEQIAGAQDTQDGFFFSDSLTGRSGQAFGAVTRAGYLTGPAVGREKGVAPLEFMPYAFFDEGMFFLDARGFRADNGEYGLNSGLGYRQYLEGLDRIFGINFYHDYDHTTGKLFKQWGFGLETYGQWWDMRGNAYFPYGTRQQLLGTSLIDGSQRFAGNNLLYDLRNTFATSLRGGDGEVGVPILGRIAARHDVRAYAGGYWYDSDSTGSFAGWSGRLQGNLLPSLQLQLQVTADSVFDTRVMFGAQWSFGGYRQEDDERPSQFARMTQAVRRNYTVASAITTTTTAGVLAINPQTGNPFFFNHVASYAAGLQNGTVENPFRTIAQTTPNVAGDIVFVHANSVFDGDINGDGIPDNVVNLEAGAGANPNLRIRYLGEGDGVVHTIVERNIGTIILPRAQPGLPNRPLFTGGVGNGVTLASNSEFSGFRMGDFATPGSGPTGHGVFGTGVSNVTLGQNEFNHVGLNGMQFNAVGTNIDAPITKIFNPGGIGIDVQGGTPGIRFSGNPNSVLFAAGSNTDPADIRNTGNIALRVENTLLGSFVNLTGAVINNTNSATSGIFLNNVAGTVAVDDATITTPTTFGIQILNSSGAFTFLGDYLIAGPGDNGIQITGLTTSGRVDFTPQGSVAINNRNQGGINLVGNDGNILFGSDVGIGEPAGGTAAAINWQNNTGITTFTGNITINSSNGDGFALGTVTANTGTFQTGFINQNNPTTVSITSGNNNIGINGIGINIRNNAGTSNISFGNNVSIAGRRNEGIFIQNNAGQVNFGLGTRIDNLSIPGFISLDSAINITQNNGDVTFQDVFITDARALGVDGYGAGMNVLNNPGAVTISNTLNITSLNAVALFVDTAGDRTARTGGFFVGNGGIITGTGLPSVDISNSFYHTQFQQVSNSGSIREGIRLVNNTGRDNSPNQINYDFIITGIGTGTAAVAGSGGSILNAFTDGVHAEATDGVSLSNMVITNAGTGVLGLNTRAIQLINDQITASIGDGLFAQDVQSGDIQNSTFTANGDATPATFHQIHLEVLTLDADPTTAIIDPYVWTLVNNTITTATGLDAVLMSNTSVLNQAAGAFLTFTENGDVVRVGNATARDAAGTNIQWNGTIDALFGVVARNGQFVGNSYTLVGSGANRSIDGDPDFGKVGIRINATSTNAADFATVNILSNSFTDTTLGHTFVSAVNLSTAGASNIVIDRETRAQTGNLINFNPGINNFSDDAGFVFSTLGPNSRVTIANSQGIPIANPDGTFTSTPGITINSNVAQGVVFVDQLTPGFFDFTNNFFNFNQLSLNGNTAVGVAYLSVRGGGTVQLQSRADNIFTSNSTPQTEFFSPGSNFFTGSILINGQTFP